MGKFESKQEDIREEFMEGKGLIEGNGSSRGMGIEVFELSELIDFRTTHNHYTI